MKALVIRPIDRASEARKAALKARVVALKADAAGALRRGLAALETALDRRAYLAGHVDVLRLALVAEHGACEAGSILAKEAGEAFGPEVGEEARIKVRTMARAVFGDDRRITGGRE